MADKRNVKHEDLGPSTQRFCRGCNTLYTPGLTVCPHCGRSDEANAHARDIGGDEAKGEGLEEAPHSAHKAQEAADASGRPQSTAHLPKAAQERSAASRDDGKGKGE